MHYAKTFQLYEESATSLLIEYLKELRPILPKLIILEQSETPISEDERKLLSDIKFGKL